MRGVKGIYSPVFYDETKSGDLGAQIHGPYILPRGSHICNESIRVICAQYSRKESK